MSRLQTLLIDINTALSVPVTKNDSLVGFAYVADVIGEYYESVGTTGTELRYDRPRHYGTPDVPLTGTLTFTHNDTDALVKQSTTIWYSGTGQVTLPSTCKFAENTPQITGNNVLTQIEIQYWSASHQSVFVSKFTV